MSTLLTWLSEKTKPVFVVATANDISHLPPELLRKGRLDEIFFVDLPTAREREEILDAIARMHVWREPNLLERAARDKTPDGFSRCSEKPSSVSPTNEN